MLKVWGSVKNAIVAYVHEFVYWDTLGAVLLGAGCLYFSSFLCQEQMSKVISVLFAGTGAAVSIPVALLALVISLMNDEIKARIIQRDPNGEETPVDKLFRQYGIVTVAWVVATVLLGAAVVLVEGPIQFFATRLITSLGVTCLAYVLLAIPPLIGSAKEIFDVLGEFYAMRERQKKHGGQ